METSLTQIWPFGDYVRPKTALRPHGQRVPVNDVQAKDGRGGHMQLIANLGAHELGKRTEKRLSALQNIVLQQFDPVDGHQGEKRMVALIQ